MCKYFEMIVDDLLCVSLVLGRNILCEGIYLRLEKGE